MKKGRFIVIDGLDGSGKTVQTNLLVEKLGEEGFQVEMVDFPQYGNWSAEFVEKYLRGEFGEAKSVNPKCASLFYALDRYAAGSNIRRWLDEGKVVVSNRYVSANKGHQLGKLGSPDEKKEFLDWLNELEYKIMGIPVPDLTLFLHMAPKIGQSLVDKKEARAYTQGRKRDIHEGDLEHLRDAERAYLFCLENDPVENWKRIVCFSDGKPRPVEEIHGDIYNVVKGILEEK